MNRINTNWEKELIKSKAHFLTAQTKEDVYYALLSLKNSFHDYHSKPLIDPDLRPPDGRAELPIKFQPIFKDGAIQYIVKSSSISAIKSGFILKELDGQNPQQLEDYFLEWTNTTSPEATNLLVANWLSKRDSRDLPIPVEGTKARFVFIDPKSHTPIATELIWLSKKTEPKPEGCLDGEFSADYKDYKPQFKGINFCIFINIKGYFIIKYFSFYYDFNNDIPRLWKKLLGLSYKPKELNNQQPDSIAISTQDQKYLEQLLKKYKPKKVLIDVRENYGGDVFPNFIRLFSRKPFSLLKRQVLLSEYMKSHPNFLLESLQLGDAEMKPITLKAQEKGEKLSPLFPFFCLTPKCQIEEATYQPEPYTKKFKVFVLAGPRCVSACDQFVAIMKDNGIAKIVGLPTNGGHSPFRAFLPLSLKNNSVVKIRITTGEGYRPNGEPLEGNPAQPDIRIEFQDNYLLKALRTLEI